MVKEQLSILGEKLSGRNLFIKSTGWHMTNLRRGDKTTQNQKNVDWFSRLIRLIKEPLQSVFFYFTSMLPSKQALKTCLIKVTSWSFEKK